MDIVDWLESQDHPDLLDMRYNLGLDDQLKELGFAYENLERYIAESISQELHPSKNIKSSIIRVVLLLPKFEQLLWGIEARGLQDFTKMIPTEWKG